jgi:hypothetical protein
MKRYRISVWSPELKTFTDLYVQAATRTGAVATVAALLNPGETIEEVRLVNDTFLARVKQALSSGAGVKGW